MRKGVSVLLAMSLALSLCACGGTSTGVSAPTASSTTTTATTATATTTLPQGEQLDTLVFKGRVLELTADGSAVLMESVGDSPLGDRVWVQLGRITDVTPQVGEAYTVTYEDMVMLSMPPRINAVTMTLAK